MVILTMVILSTSTLATGVPHFGVSHALTLIGLVSHLLIDVYAYKSVAK